MCNLGMAVELKGVEKGMEQGIAQGIKQGAEQNLLENIKSLMKTLNLTIQQAMDSSHATVVVGKPSSRFLSLFFPQAFPV